MGSWIQNLWYDFCRSSVWAALTALNSYRFEGGRNVPPTGPALLIANHQSFLDPPLAGIPARRRVCFLARKTLFDNRFFGTLISTLKTVPVDQEGVAKEGLQTVLKLLEKGEAVLVFPEGERSWTGQMQPFKPGVLLLVKRAMPPVVPIGIAGAFDALPRGGPVRLSPIFMPGSKGSLAASVGKPLDGRRLATLPRDKMLQELYDAVHTQQLRAEQLRRK
jgi:1-acyl-sn-glycerol-3-phosphate acyltransferase